jgi:7,8-dihydro-6-hydroxymethylpterin-pyrophosphokinase
MTLQPTPSYSMSPAPFRALSSIVNAVNTSEETLAVQKLQAELEVAEAELRAARLKMQFIEAKEKAEKEAAARDLN